MGHDHPLDMGEVDPKALDRLDLVRPLPHKPSIYEAKVSRRRLAQDVYMGIGYHLILTLDKIDAFCDLLHSFFLGDSAAESSVRGDFQVSKFFQNLL